MLSGLLICKVPCLPERIIMVDMLRVGVVTSAHGLAGEVKIFPTTDEPKRFETLDEVFLDTKRAGRICLHVDRVRFFKQYAIVHFRGLDRIEDVEKLLKSDVLVSRENALPLREGQYYLADLIGMTVLEEDGTVLGELADVLQTGANDVYVVRTEGEKKELLIPAIPQCIINVDIGSGKMTVHLLPGL